jgi:peroxin-12
MHPIQTATSAQTGFVFCYTCIFKWVDGSHDRQIAFMAGGGGGDERWDDDDDNVEVDGAGDRPEGKGSDEGGGSREGKWESGKGRCAVTGRRVLGGTDGLRRVMV